MQIKRKRWKMNIIKNLMPTRKITKLGSRSTILMKKTWKERAKRKTKTLMMKRIKNPSRPKAQKKLRKTRRKNQKLVTRRKKDQNQSHLRKKRKEEKAKMEVIKRKSEWNKNDHLTLWNFFIFFIQLINVKFKVVWINFKLFNKINKFLLKWGINIKWIGWNVANLLQKHNHQSLVSFLDWYLRYLRIICE